MESPNRSEAVKQIVKDHQSRFPKTKDEAKAMGEELDRVKEKVLAIICLRLNKQFGDKWVMLRRLDRGGRLGSDNLVWRSPHEHYDVLSDFGAMWKYSGLIEDMPWYDEGDAEYVDASTLPRFPDPVLDGAVPEPEPSPSPEPPDQPPSDLVERVQLLEAKAVDLGGKLFNLEAKVLGNEQLVNALAEENKMLRNEVNRLKELVENSPTPTVNIDKVIDEIVRKVTTTPTPLSLRAHTHDLVRR